MLKASLHARLACGLHAEASVGGSGSRESFPADPASRRRAAYRETPNVLREAVHIPPRIPIRPLWSHHLRMCPLPPSIGRAIKILRRMKHHDAVMV